MYFCNVAIAFSNHLSWLLLQKLCLNSSAFCIWNLLVLYSVYSSDRSGLSVCNLCHCMSKFVSFLAFATVQLRSPGIWYHITDELRTFDPWRWTTVLSQKKIGTSNSVMWCHIPEDIAHKNICVFLLVVQEAGFWICWVVFVLFEKFRHAPPPPPIT